MTTHRGRRSLRPTAVLGALVWATALTLFAVSPQTNATDLDTSPGKADMTAYAASLPSLTHFYSLAGDTKDSVGDLDGAWKGSPPALRYGAGWNSAEFDGSSYIEFPDSPDFSVSTTGELTIAFWAAITDWRGAGASEYVNYFAKGAAGAQEWTFRHYVKGGSGEAPQRQGRSSFYVFNPQGGLGAGSYYQDPSLPTAERFIVATVDAKADSIRYYVDGVLRDADTLSGYRITPRDTTTPVRLGSRGDGTGYLVGTARDLSFADRAWTSAQVKAAFKAHQAADVAPTPTPSPTPVTPTVPVPVTPTVPATTPPVPSTLPGLLDGLGHSLAAAQAQYDAVLAELKREGITP